MLEWGRIKIKIKVITFNTCRNKTTKHWTSKKAVKEETVKILTPFSKPSCTCIYIYIHCTIIWFIASSQSERGVALPAWQVSSLCPFQFSQCPTYQTGEYWPSFYLSLECSVSVSPYIGDTIHALCSGLKTCLLPTVILPYSYLSISVI